MELPCLVVALRGDGWTTTEMGGLVETARRLRDEGKLPIVSVSVSLEFTKEGQKKVIVGPHNLHPTALSTAISAFNELLGGAAKVVPAVNPN